MDAPQPSPEQIIRRAVRLAVAVAAVGPACWWVRYLMSWHPADWLSDDPLASLPPTILLMSLLAIIGLTRLFRKALPGALLLVARVLRVALARHVDHDCWIGALAHATARLPMLAATGSLLWYVEITTPWPASWFSTVIGACANVLGALFYGPLLWRWWQLGRGLC